MHMLCIRETRVYCCSGLGIREILSSPRDLLLSVKKDCVLSHFPLSSSSSFVLNSGMEYTVHKRSKELIWEDSSYSFNV